MMGYFFPNSQAGEKTKGEFEKIIIIIIINET
jgi:hypothetical protein